MEKLTQLKTEYKVIWTVSWKLLSLMHNKWIHKNSKEVEKSHKDMS